MIKQGEVAFLKTTGEAVFVLTDPQPNLVKVRRPKAGQNGIEHLNEEFFPAELESLDDQQLRFVTERKAVMEKYGPKNEEQSAVEDSRFGIN